MNSDWIGFGRIAVMLGWGVVVLRRGWKSRHARHDKSAVKDELLLLGSGLLITLLLLGGLFWFGPKLFGAGLASKYLGILVLIGLAAALAWGSNFILRSKGKRSSRDEIRCPPPK